MVQNPRRNPPWAHPPEGDCHLTLVNNVMGSDFDFAMIYGISVMISKHDRGSNLGFAMSYEDGEVI